LIPEGGKKKLASMVQPPDSTVWYSTGKKGQPKGMPWGKGTEKKKIQKKKLSNHPLAPQFFFSLKKRGGGQRTNSAERTKMYPGGETENFELHQTNNERG